MIRKDSENVALKPGLMLLLVMLIAGFAIISNPYGSKQQKKSTGYSVLISPSQSFINSDQDNQISNVLKSLVSRNNSFNEEERKPEVNGCGFDYLRFFRFRLPQIHNNINQAFLPRNNIPGSSDNDLQVVS